MTRCQIAIVALLLTLWIETALQAQTLTSKPSFLKHVTRTGKDFVHSFSVGDNATFSYALCDRQSINFSRKCTITQETITLDGSSYKRSCTIRLVARKRYKPTQHRYAITQLGQKGLVFAWNEGEAKRKRYGTVCGLYKEFLRVRVIDMQTCQDREAQITADGIDDAFVDKNILSSLNIVTYPNGNLDLVFRNEKLCRTNIRCTLKYESDSRVFGEDETIVPLLAVGCNESAKIRPLLSPVDSELLGYVVQTSLDEYLTVNLLHPVGDIMVSRVFSSSVFNIPNRISNVAVSHEDGSLGICSQPMFASNISCSRFDSEGKNTLDLTLMVKSENVDTLRIKNYQGGMIMLIGYVHTKIRGFEELDFLRFDSDGHIREYHSRRWVACPVDSDDMEVDFFERSGYRFCYFMACSWPANNTAHAFHVKIYDECYV